MKQPHHRPSPDNKAVIVMGEFFNKQQAVSQVVV
jgi:hypothetical protein